MKKTIILLIFLISIFIVAALAIIGLATGIIGNNQSETVIRSEEDGLDKYTEYIVQLGDLNLKENLEGLAAYNEDSIVVLNYEDSKNSGNLHFSVGDMVEKDQVLYTYGNKNEKSPVNGRITDIKRSEDYVEITIVNYENTDISVSIPAKYQNVLNSDTKITGTYNDTTYQLNIKSINPSVVEGSFTIVLDNVFGVYENTPINITLDLGVKENVVMVNQRYIRYDSQEKPYVEYYNDEGTVSKYYVILGTCNSEMYEIIDGEGLIGRTVLVDKKELMINEDK